MGDSAGIKLMLYIGKFQQDMVAAIKAKHFSEILDIAKIFFFPNGISTTGHIKDFEVQSVDY